jgi:hypothetical protein
LSLAPRLLFFLLLVFLVLWLLRNYRGRLRGGTRIPPNAEDMALDPQCQSYIPKREAVEMGGNFFCSRECAERYLAR